MQLQISNIFPRNKFVNLIYSRIRSNPIKIREKIITSKIARFPVERVNDR